MANHTGIEIHIKAWLPTGKGLDEQFAALSLVKTAHETGDYAPLLGAAQIEAVKTESKTRRMEAAPIAEADLPPAPPADEVQTPFDAPPPESNVGDAPTDQPSLVPDGPEELPNPTRRGRRAA